MTKIAHNFVAALVWATLQACAADSDPEAGQAARQPLAKAEDSSPFTEVAAASGLDFVHFNGMSGELYYSEMMGSGAALFDYDNDGDLDVYLVQGRLLNPSKGLADATFPPSSEMLPLQGRLYRNDLGSGAASGRLRFTDVTEACGLHADGYGMGAATGDFDNDGWMDLYLTQAGSNQLWRNLGADASGRVRFRDVTAEAKADDPAWSLSATWLDADLDGWLDLYIVNYLDFAIADHRQCRMMSGQPDYCGPQTFNPIPDRLLRNRGADARGRVTFEDWSAASGIARESGAGMGVVADDFNGDGLGDLYVANDGMANFLWQGQGDGVFRNQALVSGTAFNREGQAEAGMGVAAGDFDNDGDADLLLTHLALETHTLYRNNRTGFDDVTVASGLGLASWQSTGFGAAWIDYDNDGWLDLLAVNGAVVLIPEQVAAGDPHPLGMPNQLFRNLGVIDGSVRFEETVAGASFATATVSRGLAIGDLDNDGDADAVVANNAGAVELLENRIGQDRHWLGLRLVGSAAPRDMLGAEVTVSRPDGTALWRRVGTGGGYLSAHDPRALFGLGDDPRISAVTVRWPGGREEQFSVEVDRYTTLRQGAGQAVDDVP